MRILIDLTSLSDNFSGIERYALNISKNLIRLDSKNKYVLIFKNEVHIELKDIIEEDNSIDVIILKGKNRLIFNQIILPYNLYKLKADKYIFLAFPSPILLRKKGIYNTIHDLTAFLYPETMKKSSMVYFKYSILNAINISSKIITVSETSKIDIEKKFPDTNIVVVKNGISDVFTNFKFDNNKNNEIIEKYNLPMQYIMTLGTVEPRKNLKLLIEAFSILKKKYNIDHKLVLVGRKGWKIDEMFKGINIENDIVFTGFVDDVDLPYIYLNSRLFIFPSIYEGFGIPPIEAMYMKVPVLVSDIDVMKEVCGQKVDKFINNSLENLVERINFALFKQNNEGILLENKHQAEKFKWEDEANKLKYILKNEVLK